MADLAAAAPTPPLIATATCHTVLAHAALDSTPLYFSRLPPDLVAQVDRYLAVSAWAYGGAMKLLAHPGGSADVRLVLANGEDALLVLDHEKVRHRDLIEFMKPAPSRRLAHRSAGRRRKEAAETSRKVPDRHTTTCWCGDLRCMSCG